MASVRLGGVLHMHGVRHFTGFKIKIQPVPMARSRRLFECPSNVWFDKEKQKTKKKASLQKKLRQL